ncbi:MAG: Tex family protein [bacterium]
MDINKTLAAELDLPPRQVAGAVKLLDDGNTVPFIARYRKEATGGLSDADLRKLAERLHYLRNLESRKEEITHLLKEQGKLTPTLLEQIANAGTLQTLEDIYRPFRPKRRTRATVAREKGLEPLAQLLLAQEPASPAPEALAASYLDPEKELTTIDTALAGARDIIAEIIADDPRSRQLARQKTWTRGVMVTQARRTEKSPYEMYYDYKEPVSRLAPHRVLAINRGEREEYLRVKIEAPVEEIMTALKSLWLRPDSPTTPVVAEALEDAYQRLLAPAVERDLRRELTERGEEQALKVFAANLEKLLLQPPVPGRVVLGFDPAYRTGCKLAVVDGTGKVLTTTVIYPTPPQEDYERASSVIKELVQEYWISVVALGNGTASRESELFLARVIKELGENKLVYVVVNEAGASVYSASRLAEEELPGMDVSFRGAVSIARRLQDPLAELVKIDPKSLGVGQYQHDVNQGKLERVLAGVVENCVNSVGVDLNSASPALLQYVSGISARTAAAISRRREGEGPFTDRKELLAIPGLGPKTFQQCAGFLRIRGGKNILDNTGVHPESYPIAHRLLEHFQIDLSRGETLPPDIKKAAPSLAKAWQVGLPTLMDIMTELAKPGRDPREELPPPLFRSDVLKLEDLRPGMILTGTVRNVTDFGAFVDIGVHQDGLVHISQLSSRFVQDPLTVVSVGDTVRVKILEVDLERRRISLSMKEAN